MKTSIRINKQAFKREIRHVSDARAERVAGAAGQMVLGQIVERFDRGGDEERPWPDLWANNDAAVRRMTERAIGDKGRTKLVREYDKAKRNLDRVKKRADEGGYAVGKASGAIRKARNRLKAAEHQMRIGNTSYRRGGKPLQDTGALRASFFAVTRPTPRGWRVEVGSPLPYAVYHQEGFETSGPNYIPLTIKGAKKPKGADPDVLGLLPGVDYVMAWRGVTVPPRRMVGFTSRNRRDLLDLVSHGGL